MSVNFVKIREVLVSGFAADADPRTSAPSSSIVWEMPEFGRFLDGKTVGHAIFIRFVTNAGVEIATATADFESWFYDNGSGMWVSLLAQSAAASSQVFTSSFTGKMFARLTAIGGTLGAATKVQVWATELTSLPVS